MGKIYLAKFNVSSRNDSNSEYIYGSEQMEKLDKTFDKNTNS